MNDTTPPAMPPIAVNPLAPQHLADLRKSGLSDAQIAACGFVTIIRASEVAAILRWTRADKLGSCLALPYREVDGIAHPLKCILKLVKPLIDIRVSLRR